MSDKLTDNDRQRIEQEAKKIHVYPLSDKAIQEALFKIAEYATLYERQLTRWEESYMAQENKQQAKRIEELEDAIKSRNILQAEDKEQIKKLEGLLIRFINESQEVKTAPFHYLELMRETFKAALNL